MLTAGDTLRVHPAAVAPHDPTPAMLHKTRTNEAATAPRERATTRAAFAPARNSIKRLSNMEVDYTRLATRRN